MVVNGEEWERSPLRQKCLEVVQAGYRAIEISRVARERVKVSGSTLQILDREYNLNQFNRVFLVAFGKGAAQFAWEVGKILDWRLTRGLALDVGGPQAPWYETAPEVDFMIGTHPLPSAQNLEATARIYRLVEKLTKGDLLLVLVTGGGSSLLCSTMDEMMDGIQVTRMLTKRGAPIEELNTVRKHLGVLKGGGLAKLAYPAKVVGLIAGDVCSCAGTEGELDNVASGPTVRDETTKAAAEEVLLKYGLVPTRFRLRETPKDEMIWQGVDNLLVVCNKDALQAMAAEATRIGFRARVVDRAIVGEARQALKAWVGKIGPGEMWLAGGETTVTVRGRGKGGRNQEVVLGAMAEIFKKAGWPEGEWLVTGLASDARDNTEAAGALGDDLVLKAAREKRLEIEDYLGNNDAFNFFQLTGGLIYAAPKSFNVADLMLMARAE